MQIIVATNNEGKVREFSRIFAPFGLQAVPQKAVLPDCKVEETGTTFAENAYLKAQAVHHLTGQAVVADDSGLCVDALHGGPGVYSARYGGSSSYPEKIAKLVQALEGVPMDQRTARFVAHICYISQDGTRTDFEESCEGIIGTAPKGNRGFGFDPIFFVGGKSFAELPDQEKDALSHRGKALQKLAAYLEEFYSEKE